MYKILVSKLSRRVIVMAQQSQPPPPSLTYIFLSGWILVKSIWSLGKWYVLLASAGASINGVERATGGGEGWRRQRRGAPSAASTSPRLPILQGTLES
jgi:hypothetical protein